MTPQAASPMTRPIHVDDIKMRGTRVTVQAEPAERAGIADLLGLPSLESLEARYVLARNGERVKLEGEIAAAFHQTCTVTLEAFPVTLTVPMSLDFAPQEPEVPRRRGDKDEAEIDIEVRLNEADPPEPIVDGTIDLGAVTLEFLALALDPYPRKPGAVFAEPAPETPPESPFAMLARLKRGE